MKSNSISYYCLTLSLLIASISLTAQTSDTAHRFYDWKMRTVGQTQHWRSTPFSGYVVLRDGTQINGELKVMTRPAKNFIEFKLETPNKTLKLNSNQVDRYGLYVTRERAMGSRTKPYRESGRNLHQGTLTLLDGTSKSGWIAFAEASSSFYNDQILYHYSDVFFLEELDGLVTFHASAELKEVTQEINGNQVTYNYLETYLVDMERLVEIRSFQTGKILMDDGSWVEGKLSRLWGSNLYVRSIFFQEGTEKVKSLRAPLIQRFEINDGSRQISYVINQGVFVEVIQETDSYQLTRNPFSTSKNGVLSFMSDLATTAAQGAMANAVAKKVANSVDADSDEFKEVLNNSSREELIEMEQALAYASDVMEDNNMVDDESAKKLEAQRLALRVAAAGRPTELVESSISIMRKEWSLVNTNTGETHSFVKGGMKRALEPHLSGCGKYILLSNKEQRSLFDWENMTNVISMMEECQ